MNDANIKKLKGTLKKIQCGPRDHATQNQD
jgi:hypothetical protein